jgi:hypothetical protein
MPKYSAWEWTENFTAGNLNKLYLSKQNGGFMKKYLVFLFLTVVMFSSCTTMKKDISLNTQTEHADVNLAGVEAAIVPLEAVRGTDIRSRQSEITSARQMITSLERDATVDADYSGRLMVWSGRLAIIEGRYSDAQRLYRQSTAASAGNVPSTILGIRLEGDPAKRMEIIERELTATGQRSAGYGELQIERARALFDLNRFSEAAGSFDAAFSSGLAGVYRDNYTTARNQAWELRNTSGVSSGSLGLLGQETVNWNDCITLIKNETQLLRFISGGRNLPNNELFTQLVDRSFIPYTQDININNWPTARPRIDEPVTRSGAAWLIWHLYAEVRADRSLLTRYSVRYATGSNPRSPITDVPPLSPFFDSILGSVETEYLSLPDGRNFNPAQPIRGTELLTIFRKMDN